MQHWICIYCGALYLTPKALIDHLVKAHQIEILDPDLLEKLTIQAMQYLRTGEEEQVIFDN